LRVVGFLFYFGINQPYPNFGYIKKIISMKTLNLAQCKAAINNWSSTIKNKDKISGLLQPNYNVRITRDIYNYLVANSDNDNFHIYMGGIGNNEIIMIFIPLFSNGKEKLNLLNYAVSSYEKLSAPLTLSQSIVGDSQSSYIIETEFVVSSVVVKQSPSVLKPMVAINEALMNLINWKLGYEDWLDFEIRKGVDSKIFKAFSVGMQDLTLEFNKSWVKYSSCLFVLERGSVLKEVLPNVLFVSSSSNTTPIVRGNNILTNVFDFGSPCPPFCDRQNFQLL
jgi:hypothetical protein